MKIILHSGVMTVALCPFGFCSGRRKAWPRSIFPPELAMKLICGWPTEPETNPSSLLNLLASKTHTERSRERQRTHYQAPHHCCSILSAHSRVLKVLVFKKNLFPFGKLDKKRRLFACLGNNLHWWWSAHRLTWHHILSFQMPVPLPSFREHTWRASRRP